MKTITEELSSKMKDETGIFVLYFIKNIEFGSVVESIVKEHNFENLCFGTYRLTVRNNADLNNVRTKLLPYIRAAKNQNEI